MHWSRLFTRMLTAETKLVGPTITCSIPPTMSVNDTMPFVQFNALATDKVRHLCAAPCCVMLACMLPIATPGMIVASRGRCPAPISDLQHDLQTVPRLPISFKAMLECMSCVLQLCRCHGIAARACHCGPACCALMVFLSHAGWA